MRPPSRRRLSPSSAVVRSFLTVRSSISMPGGACRSAHEWVTASPVLPDVADDLRRGDAEQPGLGEHGVHQIGEEARATLATQPFARVRADEHADAAPLVEDAFAHELL